MYIYLPGVVPNANAAPQAPATNPPMCAQLSMKGKKPSRVESVVARASRNPLRKLVRTAERNEETKVSRLLRAMQASRQTC